MTAHDHTVEQVNTRWWEAYLVRYFLGFIVGSLCVGVIANELGIVNRLAELLTTHLHDQVMVAKPDWTAIVLTVAFLGMGYCYLASTPINVLHVGRYNRGPIDSLSRYFWLGWAIALIATVVSETLGLSFLTCAQQAAISLFMTVGFVLCDYLCKHSKYSYYLSQDLRKVPLKFHQGAKLDNYDHFISFVYLASMSLTFCFGILFLVSLACLFFHLDSSHSRFHYFIIGIPVIWIGIIQYAVLYRLLNEGPKLNQFYSLLFYARRQPGSRDIRDTYTHLREHSNSIFVVLIELCWLSLIMGCVRVYGPISAESSFGLNDTWLTGSLIALGIWMLPTVFIWSRANAMERFFAESSGVFLGP